tara:strand:+ start:189 stop:371 length:183 start_codon:yes stop_codon:yes gene_type:complete
MQIKKTVNDINFKINEFVDLLVPNGSRRTTTIRIVLGLLKSNSRQVLINVMNIKKKFSTL